MTKKILIADDEVDILETLEKRLRSSHPAGKVRRIPQAHNGQFG